MNSEQELVDAFHSSELKYAVRIGGIVADPDQARARISKCCMDLATAADVQEFNCTMKTEWEMFVFHAMLKRYGIKPYRYHKQRKTTLMVRVSKQFMNQVLWPIYIDVRTGLHVRIAQMVTALLPAIAPGPYSLPIFRHDHSTGQLCEECRTQLSEGG